MPGLASADTGKYCCSRCGTTLGDGGPRSPNPSCDGAPPETAAAPDPPQPEAVTPEPPPTYDAWELEQKLRHIERLLRIDAPDTHQREAAARRNTARVDASHETPAGWHYPAALHAKRHRSQARSPQPWLPVLTWSVLAVGLMASAFGGVLVAWAAAGGRQDLWAIGMPVGLGGQIVLVIGLILQLDRLWHDNRGTAEKLDQVDERLDDLNRTTTLLRSSRGTASGSFDPHVAGGPGAQRLLADLKSQLDRLSAKLGQEDW